MGDLLSTRYTYLKDTAVHFAFVTKRLFDLIGINTNVLLRCGRGTGIRAGSFGQCHGIMHSTCQLRRVAMRADVHVHESRRFVQHVIVQCRDLNTAAFQLGHHRSHFIFRQHQITHQHGIALRLGERHP